ncbi:ankyrin repeat domain-containing protein [Bordetella genomosp. 4]|uniref:ankyrin repeat domain-containing protein n=1 Tax=Bordetella genomosp. 4 TaxID=463044 RepID=UPI000B9E87DC|nr:ankyrin repeat domain-containing protein [Bordetella genomosp. 4]OZI52656.1 hypothetical protein CAL21_03250 [Bordetella genomosp. 4]
MVKIADFGSFETVPPLVTALIESDIAALDAALASGLDIEAEIELSEYTQEIPLVLALAVQASASVHWLVEHRANLNRADAPAFPIAARYANPDMMRYLVRHGADVHARKKVGGDAYQQALYGKKIAHLPVIESLGHSVAEYGGEAFRSAAFDRDERAVEFFLAHGVDVNFRTRDQVFSDSATPLLVAARNRDAKMCRLLVEHGADALITNRDGERPYTVAVEQGDDELAAYFKSLEPPELHSVISKLYELKPYKLPQELVDFLQSERRRIDLPGCDVGFVEFFGLTDTVPIKAGRKKMLRLSRESGDYSDTLLVWNPKSQRIGYWDVEHQEYGDIASFKDFMDRPAQYMNKVINGE